MNLGSLDARLKIPPFAQSDLAARRVILAAIGGTSTGGTIGINIPPTGCFISWVADTDCFIHWGNSSNQIAASSSVSMYMPTGVVFDFWHTTFDNYFQAIQKTAAGKLYYWRSSP